jgi:integrase
MQETPDALHGEILRPATPPGAAAAPPALPDGLPPVPCGRPPSAVRDWFDAAAAALIPDHDGTLATARSAAGAYAGRAKAGNTRRAYRAGVRAWCDWCDRFGLPCLPGRAADVAAFLAAGRGRGLSVSTLTLRRAAIRYLHVAAGCPVPTAEAAVGETMAGITRHAAETGDTPARKLAATAAVLRQILAPIETDLAGLRDRALLLLGFAGALRRAELAAVRVEHLEPCDRGLRLTLPLSKGERGGAAVTVAIPYGSTELCPVRALRQWQLAAGIADGPVFRRIWTPPRGRAGQNSPLPRLGYAAIDAGTVARIVQARAKAAGFDPDVLGGHSLKRGALSTGMERGIHPTRLKQLGRHKSYAVLDVYLELGDPFEAHPLNGVL